MIVLNPFQSLPKPLCLAGGLPIGRRGGLELETNLFAGPGLREGSPVDDFEIPLREQGDEIIDLLPPKARVIIRRTLFGFALDGFDDQQAVRLEEAGDFAD